jgi:hypothetical protein
MRAKPLRFTESPLTVYDLDEWDPLACLEEIEETGQVDLDLDYIYGLGQMTSDILVKYGVNNSHYNSSRVEGEEVGDDRDDFSNDQRRLAAGIVAQSEVVGMVTSWDDTFLSAELFNFCETTSFVPLHPNQSFDYCRKTGEFEDLGFIDTPPLRIILDVSKGDMSHSSTGVGKATMLGSRMRTPRNEFLQDWHLASYLQDGMLRTSRSSDPKYLPQIMGGSGVRASFSNPLNLYLYTHAYRGGICERIYGSATRELRMSLKSLHEGKSDPPILCQRLRERQEYLHGTYSEKIFIPTKEHMSSFGRQLPAPLIRASEGSNLFASYEHRLERTRHVIRRSDAEREWENTLRIRERLLKRYTTTIESDARQRFEKKRARAEFGCALNANTAFSHLLDRTGSIEDVIQLTQENFSVVNCGATHFTKWDAEWLFLGGKGEQFSIEDLTFSEDLFLRKEVSEDETLRVGSIPLRPLIASNKEIRTTTTIGLYQIGSGMFEWAANLASRLEQHRNQKKSPLTAEDALLDYAKDPEWVNDDSLIISMCRRDTAHMSKTNCGVILVSADKRLGNQIANSCGIAVYRVDPRDYIPWSRDPRIGPDSEAATDPFVIQSFFQRPVVPPPVKTYIDTGSVNAFLAKMQTLDDGGSAVRKTISSSSLPDGRREVSYLLIPVEIPRNLRCFYHAPVVRQRRFKPIEPTFGESISRRSAISTRSEASKDWRSRA